MKYDYVSKYAAEYLKDLDNLQINKEYDKDEDEKRIREMAAQYFQTYDDLLEKFVCDSVTQDIIIEACYREIYKLRTEKQRRKMIRLKGLLNE